MNRRELFKRLGGAAAAVSLGGLAVAKEQHKRYGPVTVERHLMLQRQGIHLHVFHKGRDITRQCRFADDTGDGMAELILRDANGRAYRRPLLAGEYGDYSTELATQTVHGVTIREGARL